VPASAFLSHSWKDKPLARKLARHLSSFGVRVWLDEAEIKIGDSLIQKIRSAIDEVDYVVALLSPQSCDSEWVTRELDIAMNQEIEGRRVKVLPLLASRCSIPGFLQGKLYADISSPQKFKQAIPMLLDRLEAGAVQSRRNKDRPELEWLPELQRALKAGDEDRIYESLGEIKIYDHRELLKQQKKFKSPSKCRPRL
jgi:TIR domain